MKNGKSLERLVASLETALVESSDTLIESPKRLPDKVTGKLREHDVVISANSGHHSTIIAIECRDRSRPVGMSQIEAFRTKCENTGVNVAVIVSPLGFCKTAIEKARFYSIRCLTLDEVGSVDWLQCESLNVYGYENCSVRIKIKSDGVVVKKGDTDFDFVDKNGSLIPSRAWEQLCTDLLNYNKVYLRDVKGTQKEKYTIKVDDLFAYKQSSGNKIKIEELDLELEYCVKVAESPFRIRKYIDTDNDVEIIDVASAQVGDEGEVRVVYKKGKGYRFGFFPKNKKDQ